MKFILVVLVLLLLLGGCGPTLDERRQEAINSIEYIQKDGLCYAMLRSRNAYGAVYSITSIPCDKVR